MRSLCGLDVERFYEGCVLLSDPDTGEAFLAPCVHHDEDGLEVPLGDPDAFSWTDPTDDCLH